MPAGEQAYEQSHDHSLLAHKHAADFVRQAAGQSRKPRKSIVPLFR
jgi:hypothetical protein